MYKCVCEREFEKSQSLNAHYSHCKIYRNGIPPNDRFKTKRGWSKGLSKDTDKRILNISKKYSLNIQEGITIPGFKGKMHNNKTKTQMSITRSSINSDNAAHCKFYEISNGNKTFKVQGTYEKDFALFLNKKGIKWNRLRIKYDNTHHYTPDFYIEDLDIYIEIKGWLMDRDIIKYRKFFSEHDFEIYCCLKEDLDKILTEKMTFRDLPLLKSFL